MSEAGFTIEAALQPSWDDLTRGHPGLLSMELTPPDDEIAAWPRCPQHPRNHPLAPREVLDRPTWCCPVTGYAADEIGQLS